MARHTWSCPKCNARMVERALTVDDAITPTIRRRRYRCAKCATELTSSEWLDTRTEEVVYHLAELTRAFSHPHLIANLGENKQEYQKPGNKRLVLHRWNEDGSVTEWRGTAVRPVWEIMSQRQPLRLSDRALAVSIKNAVKKYNLPIRVLEEGPDHIALPEGAWHRGQLYGNPEDPRYARITFGLIDGAPSGWAARPPKPKKRQPTCTGSLSPSLSSPPPTPSDLPTEPDGPTAK